MKFLVIGCFQYEIRTINVIFVNSAIFTHIALKFLEYGNSNDSNK